MTQLRYVGTRIPAYGAYKGKWACTLFLSLSLISGFARADDAAMMREAQQAMSEKDFTTAFADYTVLAETGNASAQYILGLMFQNGLGTQKNNQQAIKWYKSAALQGNVSARKALEKQTAQGNMMAKDALREVQDMIVLAPPAKPATNTAAPKAAPQEANHKSSPRYYLGGNLGLTGKLVGIKNSPSLGLAGGYKFTPNLGIELAFNSLYRNANADALAAASKAGATGSFGLNAFSVSGQYAYYLSNEFSLQGSLGLHRSSYTLQRSGMATITGTSTNLLIGTKAQYDIGKNFAIRGGIDFYRQSGGITGTLTDVGVGVLYRF